MIATFVTFSAFGSLFIFLSYMAWEEGRENKRKSMEEGVYEASRREYSISTVLRSKHLDDNKFDICCDEGKFILRKEEIRIFNELKEGDLIDISFTRDCRDGMVFWDKLIKKIRIVR
jgi:hypothetical protein